MSENGLVHQPAWQASCCSVDGGRKVHWIGFLVAVTCTLPSLSPSSLAACSASYTINLTVELGSDLTNGKDNVLVELRQGAPGTSKVLNKKEFVGRSATVVFSGLCAGAYFIDVGNGEKVAVGPIHDIRDGQQLNTTVRVTPSMGNIGVRSRNGL